MGYIHEPSRAVGRIFDETSPEDNAGVSQTAALSDIAISSNYSETNHFDPWASLVKKSK